MAAEWPDCIDWSIFVRDYVRAWANEKETCNQGNIVQDALRERSFVREEKVKWTQNIAKPNAPAHCLQAGTEKLEAI